MQDMESGRSSVGIAGSEALNVSSAQYYRDLLNQKDIQKLFSLLLAENEKTESELANSRAKAKSSNWNIKVWTVWYYSW